MPVCNNVQDVQFYSEYEHNKHMRQIQHGMLSKRSAEIRRMQNKW